MNPSLRLGYLVQQPLNEMPTNLGHRLYILALRAALIDAGHQVTFLNLEAGHVLSHSDKVTSRLRPRRTTAFAMRIAAAIAPLLPRLGSLNLGLLDSRRFSEACRAQLATCDLLHEHFGLLQWGGILAHRALRVPHVLHVHSDDLDELRVIGRLPAPPIRQLMRWQTRACLSSTDAIIAVSNAVRERLIAHWHIDAGKIFVLPNAVEAAFFAPTEPPHVVRTRLGFSVTDRLIVFLGSFHVWYDLGTLVRAFAQVHAQIPGARLLMAGDGTERYSTEALVHALHLENAVVFAGCLEHEQVPGLLAAADVAVLPVTPLDRDFWCSPMKLFEYMAAGKAIVASRTGQIADVLRDGYSARLVPPGDRDALANTLLALLQDDISRRELGARARHAAERYTWPRYVERLIGVYEFAASEHERALPRRQAPKQ